MKPGNLHLQGANSRKMRAYAFNTRETECFLPPPKGVFYEKRVFYE